MFYAYQVAQRIAHLSQTEHRPLMHLMLARAGLPENRVEDTFQILLDCSKDLTGPHPLVHTGTLNYFSSQYGLTMSFFQGLRSNLYKVLGDEISRLLVGLVEKLYLGLPYPYNFAKGPIVTGFDEAGRTIRQQLPQPVMITEPMRTDVYNEFAVLFDLPLLSNGRLSEEFVEAEPALAARYIGILNLLTGLEGDLAFRLPTPVEVAVGRNIPRTVTFISANTDKKPFDQWVNDSFEKPGGFAEGSEVERWSICSSNYTGRPRWNRQQLWKHRHDPSHLPELAYWSFAMPLSEPPLSLQSPTELALIDGVITCHRIEELPNRGVTAVLRSGAFDSPATFRIAATVPNAIDLTDAMIRRAQTPDERVAGLLAKQRGRAHSLQEDD